MTTSAAFVTPAALAVLLLAFAVEGGGSVGGTYAAKVRQGPRAVGWVKLWLFSNFSKSFDFLYSKGFETKDVCL